MDDWTEEFSASATAANNAFEDLRKRLRKAEESRQLPKPGEIVGRYRIVRELGHGGFGSVYEVEHELLGHRFAMKLLNPHISSDPAWVTRFREEARITSLIGHENIVFVTDFGEDKKWGSFFVMEHLVGEPLDVTLARDGPQRAERVATFAHAAASAFAAVHDVGVVHCDLKPSNVFTVPRPRQPELWKFLDFGTSTVVMASVVTKALFGTPLYMAPEQAIGEEVTPLADQFSLTSIMYEMLTGRPPWDIRNWFMATPEVRAKNPPAPPSSLSPMCPKAWDEVLLRGLALAPADRWANVSELVRALDDALNLQWTPSIAPQAGPPSVEIIETAKHASVVVDVATGESTEDRPTVRVKFQSQERFMREVHRNLSAGGLFVPSEELLSLRESVRIELVVGGETATFAATVVGHELRRDVNRGFAVGIVPDDRPALDAFIDAVRGRSLQPHTMLRRTDVAPPASLTPGAWFVLSRIDDGTRLKELRTLCAGLPVDVDVLVSELVKRKLITLSTSRVTAAAPLAAPPQAPLTRSEIDAVLERVDFHRAQANYLSAADVLQRAIEMSPRVADFHHRLAVLRMEFEADPAKALPAALRAAELEPDNVQYVGLVDSIRSRA